MSPFRIPAGFAEGIHTWEITKNTDSTSGYYELGVVTKPHCLGDKDRHQHLTKEFCGITYTYSGNSTKLFECIDGSDRHVESNKESHWDKGQTVQVTLDCELWKISFRKNDEYLGTIDMRKNLTYHPAISYRGKGDEECQDYKLSFY